MNTPISELNEIALSVSSTLKIFDVQTTFNRHKYSSYAYSNFNMLEVKKYPDIRKPFGIQAILESFAKSVGFKSYNGLLNSGLKSIQLRNDALNHLNPNPLNPYYTMVWERFCFVIMEAAINNELLSADVVKNFKKNNFFDLLSFKNSIVLDLVEVEHDYSKPNKESVKFYIQEKKKKYIPYYAIASFMYCIALEKLVELKGYKDWFNDQNFDFKAIDQCCAKDKTNERIEIRIPIVDMMNKPQWGVWNSSKFLHDMVFAMAEFFGVIVRFEGEGKSQLDKVAVFKLKTTDVPELMVAQVNKHNLDNYRKACDVVLKAVQSDQGFYACDLVENNKFKPLILTYCAENINHYYEGIHFKAVNKEKCFGRKTFWVNAAFNYLKLSCGYDKYRKYYYSENPKQLVSVEDCIALIEGFLEDKLNAVIVTANKKPFHDDGVQYSQKYVLTANNSSLEKLIPRYVSVDSVYPLDHYAGELFIQNDLLSILSNNSNIDLDCKLVGHPDALRFSTGEEIRIEKTCANVVSECGYYFYALNMVQQISLNLNFELEEKIGLPERSVEDKQLYYETDDKVYFSVSMRFTDMFYKFAIVDEEINVSPYIDMLAALDKKTNKLSVKHNPVNNDEIDNLLLNYSECPNIQQICDYLIGMDDIHELVYAFFMMFYNGRYKDLIHTVDKNETFQFSINPIDVTSKDEGYMGLEDILDSELSVI